MSATVTIEVTAVAPPVDNALAVAATTENEADQQQPQNDEEEIDIEAYIASKYFPPIYEASEDSISPPLHAVAHNTIVKRQVDSTQEDNAFVLENVLTAEEAATLVQRAEALGFEPATVYSTEADDNIVVKEVRDNFRVLEKFKAMADALWQVTSPFFPDEIDGKKKVGLFDLLRFYRYHPGQSFAPHVDHTVYPEELDGTESRYTFLFYLNDGCEGGETRFTKIEDVKLGTPSSKITPRTGLALAFRHENEHEGCIVNGGCKYIVRTDVMYK